MFQSYMGFLPSMSSFTSVRMGFKCRLGESFVQIPALSQLDFYSIIFYQKQDTHRAHDKYQEPKSNTHRSATPSCSWWHLDGNWLSHNSCAEETFPTICMEETEAMGDSFTGSTLTPEHSVIDIRTRRNKQHLPMYSFFRFKALCTSASPFKSTKI